MVCLSCVVACCLFRGAVLVYGVCCLLYALLCDSSFGDGYCTACVDYCCVLVVDCRLVLFVGGCSVLSVARRMWFVVRCVLRCLLSVVGCRRLVAVEVGSCVVVRGLPFAVCSSYFRVACGCVCCSVFEVRCCVLLVVVRWLPFLVWCLVYAVCWWC